MGQQPNFHEKFQQLPLERQVAVNAAILDAFQNPDNGFVAKFRDAVRTTGDFQQSLDALRLEVNTTIAPSTKALVDKDSHLKVDLGRQAEILRDIGDTMVRMETSDRMFPASHYAAIAKERPMRSEIPNDTPLPELSPPYMGDMAMNLNHAVAKVEAAKCVSPSTAIPENGIVPFRPKPIDKAPGCSRT